MKLYYPITVDLYETSGLKVMDAQQGNVGRGALVTLTANGMVVDPTGEEIELYAKKPDGTVSWLECCVENGKIKIDFTNQMLMVVGSLQIELRLKTETEDITTPIFVVNVRKSNVQNAEMSENEIPILDKKVTEAIESYFVENPIDKGKDGVSPVISVSKKGKVTTMTIVDAEGTKVFEINDGDDAQNNSTSKIGEVTLLASGWIGEANLFSQVVNIDGVTENSQVDLTPSVAQLAVFYEKDLAFVTENDNGVVTVYAIGQKPQNDYTIQVTITEVEYE